MVDGIDCIRAAALELALPFPTGTNPFDTQDVQIQLLLALANGMGQELAREYAWTSLQREFTVLVNSNTPSAQLPIDWNGLLPSTAYASGTAWPLVGSLTPGQWASLTAWSAAPVVGGYFRVQGEYIEFAPGTPAQTVTLAYRSVWWARSADELPESEELTVLQPFHVFDRRLFINAIKHAFKESRGFDTTASADWLERSLGRAKGADASPPVLEVGRRRRSELGGVNLPPTGWGK